LLGVNCGFSNSDVGTLPLTAVDLEAGWVNFPRAKTGTPRRCPLWPETVHAVREALACRKEPKDSAHAGLVFVTHKSGPWHAPLSPSPVSKEFRKVLRKVGITGGRCFYALRHTFETVGGEAKDQVAVDHIMGHTRDDMASVYRERISDARLRAVADYVRGWLFARPQGTEDRTGEGA
jgi:integrase